MHATIAGVALALLTPARPFRGREVLTTLEHRLHPVSAWVVVPLFALANAGVDLRGGLLAHAATSRLAWAVAAGLIVGKTVGIAAVTLAAVRARLGVLPAGVKTVHIWGLSAVAGIGFTVSLFITGLAYQAAPLVNQAKVGIFAGSLASGAAGAIILLSSRRRPGRFPGGDRTAMTGPRRRHLPRRPRQRAAGDRPRHTGVRHGQDRATPAPARAGRPGRATAALAGLGEPVVVVLLLIAFFSALVGKTINSLLLLLAAAALGWDTARTRWRPAAPGGGAAAAASGWNRLPQSQPGREPVTVSRRRLCVLAGFTAAALYAWVAGSFTRYSWPATVAVTGLAVIVVTTGWRGPLRPRADPGRLPAPGTALWADLVTAGSAWELAAFFQQPSLRTASYAHPRISALTDPLLASHTGRSAVLAAWLAVGWFLVRR